MGGDIDYLEEEFTLYMIRETPKAYWVSERIPDYIYYDDDRVCIPKSQIDVKEIKSVSVTDKDVVVKTNTIKFLCPEWLAIEKGFI